MKEKNREQEKSKNKNYEIYIFSSMHKPRKKQTAKVEMDHRKNH